MIYVSKPSSTLIFRSSFCRSICSFINFTLILSFGFHRLSFKHVFCKKNFKFDLFSFTLIGKSIVINTISLEPKNSEQSCNYSFTLVLRDDIFKKY
jgi:hypothetical protein